MKRRGLVDDPAAEVSSAILTHHTPQSKQDHHQPGLTRSTLPLLLCAQRRAGKLSVGPILLGFFLFVIVGSCTKPIALSNPLALPTPSLEALC